MVRDRLLSDGTKTAGIESFIVVKEAGADPTWNLITKIKYE